jgi:DNA-binding transcriptional MerR regulator
MEERRYIISDASKLIEVESHVLRYWEEELDIDIPRNEMGHRYYTDFYIELFKKIKELKDSGFQLKAIKILVPELMEMQSDKSDNKNDNMEVLRDELFSRLTDTASCNCEVSKDASDNERMQYNEKILGYEENVDENEKEYVKENVLITSNEDTLAEKENQSSSKLEQFQTIISEVVSNALKENTGMLGKEVSDIVSDNVIKEMDYLMHIREKQEEERYKKLDEAIRNCQLSRKENAKITKGIIGKIKRLQN